MITSRTTLAVALRSAACAAALLLATSCGAATGPAPGAETDGDTQVPTISAESVIDSAGMADDTAFCGDKPITLGIHDGFGSNGWSKSSMAAVRSGAARCPNVKQVVQIGGGSLQKSISDVNGMVAQGIDAGERDLEGGERFFRPGDGPDKEQVVTAVDALARPRHADVFGAGHRSVADRVPYAFAMVKVTPIASRHRPALRLCAR